jgi:hypothetical protein
MKNEQAEKKKTTKKEKRNSFVCFFNHFFVSKLYTYLRHSKRHPTLNR